MNKRDVAVVTLCVVFAAVGYAVGRLRRLKKIGGVIGFGFGSELPHPIKGCGFD